MSPARPGGAPPTPGHGRVARGQTRPMKRMDWTHYRFRSLWSLDAPPDGVHDVLADPEGYPRWWPQVREVTRLDALSGVLRIRSVLPYDLVLTAREVRRDRAAGILETSMTGDVDGWARWTVVPDGRGTLARYDQEVRVTKPLLRRLAVPGRPAFRANHALMMRAGRRGLAAHLRATGSGNGTANGSGNGTANGSGNGTGNSGAV